MDHLEINTVSRKRLDRSALIYGVIAAVLLIGGLLQYFQRGSIAVVEEICRQLGILEYLQILTWVMLGVLLLVALRGLRTVIRKRRELNGQFIIDPQAILIKKKGQEFQLTGSDLQEIIFELKTPKSEIKNKNIGESFVRIPSPNGTYHCELDIKDHDCHTQLINLIKHFEEVHNVKVELKITA